MLSWAAVTGGYVLLVAGLFHTVVFSGYVPASPDSVSPMATTMALDALREAGGRYPLWQPWSFSGMPTVGAFTYLNGLYYPGALLAAAGMGDLWLQLLHLVFAGLGGFVLLRRFRLHDIAAFFGGAAFLLTPYMVTMFVYGHGSQLMTAAYMPWVLWAALRLFDRARLADAGVLAILAGLQLQRGHVQIAYYTWMLLLLLCAVRIATAPEPPPAKARKALLAAGGLALAFLISAVIYVPVFQYTPWSVRGAGSGGGAAYDYATMWSMHPAEFLTYLLPGSFGFGGITYWGRMPFTDYPNYAGVVVLFLAAAGLAAERRNIFAWFLAGTSVLMVLLAFGRHFSPVYDLFYHFVPFFSRFRVPSMALVVVSFNLSLLAGFGLNAVMRRVEGRALVVLRAGALMLAAALIVFMAAEGSVEQLLRARFPAIPYDNAELSALVSRARWEAWKGSFQGFVFFSALFAGLLWLRSKQAIGSAAAGTLLVVLALADLLAVDRKIVYPGENSLRSSQFVPAGYLAGVMGPDPVTRFLTADGGRFRIHPAGALFGENKFSVSGLESTGGYHPAKLLVYDKALRASQNLSNIPLLRMLDVRYVLSTSPIGHPDLDPVFEGDLRLVRGPVRTLVYRLKGQAGRAWFVREATAASSEEEALAAVMGGVLDVGSGAVVENAPWKGRKVFGTGRIEAIETAPEKVAVSVDADGESLLVLSEVFYPLRWKMQVDGRDRPTLKINGLLRGVVVPPGRHEVVCSFDRSGFESGRRVSFGAFGVALLLAFSGLVRRRDGRAEKNDVVITDHKRASGP